MTKRQLTNLLIRLFASFLGSALIFWALKMEAAKEVMLGLSVAVMSFCCACVKSGGGIEGTKGGIPRQEYSSHAGSPVATSPAHIGCLVAVLKSSCVR